VTPSEEEMPLMLGLGKLGNSGGGRRKYDYAGVK
jgi:hypothetical protein